MEIGQIVKFSGKSRFNEWEKGDIGRITDIIVQYPDNQGNIYLILPFGGTCPVWVYEAEIGVFWDQLTLF